MDAFSNELNELLVDTFWTILKVEEQMLKQAHGLNLSISEMHLVEAVGKGTAEGRTISDLAQELDLARPSVTVSINKLVQKGFVEKRRDEKDGRLVFVTLTERGRKVNAVHSYFHSRMIRELTRELGEEEKQTLTHGLQKLKGFFERKAEEGRQA